MNSEQKSFLPGSALELGAVPEALFWDLMTGFPSPEEVAQSGSHAVITAARFVEEFPDLAGSQDWIGLFNEKLFGDEQELRHHCAKAIRAWTRRRPANTDLPIAIDTNLMLVPGEVNIEALQAYAEIATDDPVVADFRSLIVTPDKEKLDIFLNSNPMQRDLYGVDALELVMRSNPDWMTPDIFEQYMTTNSPANSWKDRALTASRLLLAPGCEDAVGVCAWLQQEPTDLVKYKLSEVLKLKIRNGQLTASDALEMIDTGLQEMPQEVKIYMARLIPAVAQQLAPDQKQLLDLVESLKQQILTEPPATGALLVKALSKSIFYLSSHEVQLGQAEWLSGLVKSAPYLEVKAAAVKCLARRSKFQNFSDSNLLDNIQAVLGGEDYAPEEVRSKLFLADMARDSMVIVNRTQEFTQKYVIGNERVIKVLGQNVSIPGGTETLRISIGEVSRIVFDHEGKRVAVLMLNRSRLGNEKAEFSPISGGFEFKDEPAKKAFADKFAVAETRFDHRNPLDVRIRQFRIDEVKAVVETLLDRSSPYIDTGHHLTTEFRQEMGDEMGELSQLSQGTFDIQGYYGPLPGGDDIKMLNQVVFPVQKSNRYGKGEDSIRTQMVYDVKLPLELEAFIKEHGTWLPWGKGNILNQTLATPFLFIDVEAIPDIIAKLEKSQSESLLLPDCRFGNTAFPVLLSGLLRTFKGL